MTTHHQPLEDPLVPGMLPVLTRVLAVGGDAARLHLLATNLGLRGYQVASSTDPAAAMARLRHDILQGRPSFNLVIVDCSSEYTAGARAAAEKLFEFAVLEPQLSAYAIREKEIYGPLAMEDLDRSRKPICNVESNGTKSPEATLNGPNNTSPSTATSTITNFSFSGRRAASRRKKLKSDANSQEVEHNGERPERERQQPSEKPKKDRVVWTDELHQKFVVVYNELMRKTGAAVPKKILEVMGDPTLTRENIASHLQKHKLNLEREASFPSANTPEEQAQPDLSATVYINYGMNVRTMLEAQTESGMQESSVVIHTQIFQTTDRSNKSAPVNVPLKDSHLGADPKHSSLTCVGNSDDNSLHGDFNKILNNEPEASWEMEFLSSDGD